VGSLVGASYGLPVQDRISPELDGRRAPFATWAYRPAYLPHELAIEMAVDTPLTEPELFYLAFASRRRLGADARAVTRVAIGMPVGGPRSAAAQAIEARGLVSFHVADRFVMTIGLDGERAGTAIDVGALAICA
jgi:hypothetical protein